MKILKQDIEENKKLILELNTTEIIKEEVLFEKPKGV